MSFFLPSTTKRRSGRSLQLGKEEPKDDEGEGIVLSVFEIESFVCLIVLL